MSKELIGAWSGKPLVAGECNLCGNQGLGNMGLWLCDLHVKVIVREHAPQLLLAHTEAMVKAERVAEVLKECGDCQEIGFYCGDCRAKIREIEEEMR